MVDPSRKSLVAALIVTTLLMPGFALAQGGPVSETERVKAAANTYHASGKTKVSVELKDGRSYKGRIT